jgi:myo-inositol-1-phosphate synthase
MHATVGGYHVRDIEFSAAIDVVTSKVGLDLSEVIWAEPNNTVKFADVPRLGVPVNRGMTHYGLGKYLLQKVEKAEGPTDDITRYSKIRKQMW